MHDAWDGIPYFAVGMRKINRFEHTHQKFILLLSLKCRLKMFSPLSIISFCAQNMQGNSLVTCVEKTRASFAVVG